MAASAGTRLAAARRSAPPAAPAAGCSNCGRAVGLRFPRARDYPSAGRLPDNRHPCRELTFINLERDVAVTLGLERDCNVTFERRSTSRTARHDVVAGRCGSFRAGSASHELV